MATKGRIQLTELRRLSSIEAYPTEYSFFIKPSINVVLTRCEKTLKGLRSANNPLPTLPERQGKAD